MKKGIHLAIAFLLILGIAFRFYHLDRKVYWLDETFTALRVSGYSARELVEELPQEKIIAMGDVQRYYHPSSDRNFSDVSKALASHAEHAPFYFVMVRFWREWFGSSVAATRSLSAVISLLSFPCMYWLCRELFSSSLAAGLGMALLAISPFQVLYAQEARQYSLLTVAILFSSAALLRAIRFSQRSHFTSLNLSKLKLSNLYNWGLYALSVSFGLYTHLLFGLVIFAHATYSIALERVRWTRMLRAYGDASMVGVLGFAPWIIVILLNPSGVQNSAAWQNEFQRPNLTFYLKSWLGNIARQFVDFGLSSDSGSLALKLFIPILLSCVGLVLYSLYFAYKTSDRKTFLFLITLTVIPWLILAIPDLILGSTRSNIQRYIIPTFVGMQLSVTYLFATQVGSKKKATSRLWTALLGLVLVLGIISSGLSAQAQVWWNKRADAHSLEVKAILESSQQPLLIAKAHPGMRLGVLSYQLDPNIPVWIVGDRFSNIPDEDRTIFIYDPSPDLHSQLQNTYGSNLKPVILEKSPFTGLNWLWKIEDS
ncbi:glycosyltransferase family 39 protein [Roseofilum casamattae]|uniref:Glycosyltransferase family 39 protein n=1 Tax=Roseofilum casamattae BLCC-M143 TaxID=3022442 RepID=A0ABT7BUM3_9CYAN|nr:glycosyltransferase family 39 protein [Roseofilum casamattae]MDJ1182891.1 glycosyltransferase family 39 protein [Roseofilum casamattae BLCC-M143]